jgi:hypothetical protein
MSSRVPFAADTANRPSGRLASQRREAPEKTPEKTLPRFLMLVTNPGFRRRY